jgi:hypothetical protein
MSSTVAATDGAVNLRRKHAYGSSPFAFAVPISGYRVKLAVASCAVSLNSQLLRSVTNGRMAFSQRLLSISPA